MLVNRKQLIQAINSCAKLSRRIVVSQNGGELSLSPLSSVASAAHYFSADDEYEHASVAVDVKSLLAACKASRDHEISISVNGTLSVDTISLSVTDVSVDPPTIGDVDASCEIDGDWLRKAILAVIRATDKAGLRYSLDSICLGVNLDDYIVAVIATDARRMHVFGDADQKTIRNLLIPIDVAKAICEKVSETETILVQWNSEGRISFSSNNWQIVSDPIVGLFPRYQDIVPRNPHLFGVCRKEMLSILRRAKKFVDDDCKVQLTIDGTDVRINVCNLQANYSETLKWNSGTYSVPNVMIELDVDYLIDAFNAVDTDIAEFSFAEKDNPIVIRSQLSGNVTAVVMPFSK